MDCRAERKRAPRAQSDQATQAAVDNRAGQRRAPKAQKSERSAPCREAQSNPATQAAVDRSAPCRECAVWLAPLPAVRASQAAADKQAEQKRRDDRSARCRECAVWLAPLPAVQAGQAAADKQAEKKREVLEWCSPSVVSGQVVRAGLCAHLQHECLEAGVRTYAHTSQPVTEEGLWQARVRTTDHSEEPMERFWSNTVEGFLSNRRNSEPNDVDMETSDTDFIPPRLANSNNSCWMNAVLQVTNYRLKPVSHTCCRPL